ncbi:hypothetical protein ACH4Q6_21305 [Streptomyces lydicus]|uniref:hypothetical protein n=1 Tax=Streptomyces lydicus TaxID=47763 RepID=UPI00379FD6F8
MNADNKAPVAGDRDVIRPLDSHQPISGAGVTAQVAKPGDRDIVKPMDSHQPIIGAGLAPEVAKPGDRDIVKPMDSHQPIAAPMRGDSHQPSPGNGAARKD